VESGRSERALLHPSERLQLPGLERALKAGRDRRTRSVLTHAADPDFLLVSRSRSDGRLLRRSGTESSLTLSWRGMDSNFQYAEAV
jgi:hypothetical protein